MPDRKQEEVERVQSNFQKNHSKNGKKVSKCDCPLEVKTGYVNQKSENDDKPKEHYENIRQFFKSQFGGILKISSQKTSKRYQGQSIYKVTRKNSKANLKKGDQFYLDNLHKDHLEVFDSKGNFKQVLNLDGTINDAKTTAASGRTL